MFDIHNWEISSRGTELRAPTVQIQIKTDEWQNTFFPSYDTVSLSVGREWPAGATNLYF